MENQEDILQIRLTGSGVRPQTLRAKEVADLLKGLEESLFHIVSAQHEEIAKEEIFISLTQIKDESAGFCFQSNLKSVMVAGFMSLSNAIATGDYSHLPPKSIEGVKGILKISSQHDCATEFKISDEVVAVLYPNSSIETEAPDSITGYTTIYPYIKKIGGSKPTVAMRINPEHPFIYVHTSEENAKKLGSRLYQTVGMTGTATWSYSTYQLLNFKIDQILDFKESPDENAFDTLRDLLGPYWDEIKDIDAYLMRGDE